MDRNQFEPSILEEKVENKLRNIGCLYNASLYWEFSTKQTPASNAILRIPDGGDYTERWFLLTCMRPGLPVPFIPLKRC